MAFALAFRTLIALIALSSAPPDLLSNPGFERASGWTAYEAGFAFDETVRRSGERSIRCVSAAQDELRGATYRIVLNQTAAAPIIVSGWSRAQGVSGTPNNDYSIYIDLIYTDGTPLWGQTAPFATGTHDWTKQQVLVVPEKPVRELFVHALFRRHSGTAWFDDFHAAVLSSTGLFDSQPISPPKLPVRTTRGWFVRDVATESPIVPISAAGHALRVMATSQQTVGSRSQITVADLDARSRALTIYYVERMPANATTWWNDIRTPVQIAGGRAYQNVTRTPNVGSVGLMSLYPLGCVTGRGFGRAVALPPDLGPRIARIGYNAATRLFYVAFDIALTPANRRNNRNGRGFATLAVSAYATDPAWGFRSAAERYYRLFPTAFARRAKAEGIWIPFTAPGSVQHVEDFGIAYHEGDDTIAADDKLGILSFRYTEPMTWWMAMKPDQPRTYDEGLRLVREAAAGKDEGSKRWAQCVLNSGSQDANGRFNVDFINAPWSNGAVWALNPNPALPHPPGEVTKALHSYTPEMANGMYDSSATGERDGEYLDSLEGWADVLDFRPESIAYASMPPAFTTDAKRPVIPTWFSVWELTRYMRDDLRRRGKLLMANATPWRIHAFAPLLDVLGTETNWNPGGTWQPDSDAVFNLRRTLCYHKPYLLLQNTDFNRFGADLVERYFQRSMFYGVFPSMFSVDAANHPYWQNPAWYNRDRPLFKRYIPAISRLSAAGWEPVTRARSSDPRVWLERFGTRYLTVLNSARERATATVTVDLNRLGIRGSVRYVDAVTGEELAGRKRATILLDLAPEQALAIRIEAVR
jgi:hypothetical protein